MSNKQVHELGKLSKADFLPTVDNFLIQKASGGTYRAKFFDLINSPSANLPGTRAWSWNWLAEPEYLIPYNMIHQKLSGLTGNPLIKDFKVSWSQKVVGSGKTTSSVPVIARSILMSAYARNCEVSLARARSSEVICDRVGTVLDSKDWGWNYFLLGEYDVGDSRASGHCSESLFIVEHVGKPASVKHGIDDINLEEGTFITFKTSTPTYPCYFKGASPPRRNDGGWGQVSRNIPGLGLTAKTAASQIPNGVIPATISDSDANRNRVASSELFYVKMHAWA